jgi:hypothetical protein
VDVIAVRPTDVSPHIELLCYRSVAYDNVIAVKNNDIAATRLVLETTSTNAAMISRRAITDPDGHRLILSTSEQRFDGLDRQSAQNGWTTWRNTEP